MKKLSWTLSHTTCLHFLMEEIKTTIAARQAKCWACLRICYGIPDSLLSQCGNKIPDKNHLQKGLMLAHSSEEKSKLQRLPGVCEKSQCPTHVFVCSPRSTHKQWYWPLSGWVVHFYQPNQNNLPYVCPEANQSKSSLIADPGGFASGLLEILVDWQPASIVTGTLRGKAGVRSTNDYYMATIQLRALSKITNPLYVPSFLVLYFMDDKITKLRVYGTQELIEYR